MLAVHTHKPNRGVTLRTRTDSRVTSTPLLIVNFAMR